MSVGKNWVDGWSSGDRGRVEVLLVFKRFELESQWSFGCMISKRMAGTTSSRKTSRLLSCVVVEQFERRNHNGRVFVRGIVFVKNDGVYDMYINVLADESTIEGVLNKRANDFLSVVNAVVDKAQGRVSLNERSKVCQFDYLFPFVCEMWNINRFR